MRLTTNRFTTLLNVYWIDHSVVLVLVVSSTFLAHLIIPMSLLCYLVCMIVLT